MKKIFFQHKKIVTILVILIAMFLVIASTQKIDKDNQGADNVPQDTSIQKMISTFETVPPVAEEIFIQKLQRPDQAGNTVLIHAKFPPSEKRLANISSFVITLDDNRRIVFSDSGPDEAQVKDDNIFTAALRLDESVLVKLITSNNEIIRKKRGIETDFLSRSAVERKLHPFDMESFRNGKVVLLELVLFSIVNAASLPGIRDKSLMVRDLSVVNDLSRTYDPCRPGNKGTPTGAWSFRKLVENMVQGTGVTAKDFLVDWVENFLFSAHSLPSGDQTSNRLRSKERLVKAWMKNSSLVVPSSPGVPAGWQTSALKVEEFPVRLLAIVNRLDLRGNSGYGGFSNAGEGRFVFCFVDSRTGCSTGNNQNGTMTFILEYAVPLTNCNSLKDYATKWWNLRSTPFGASFNNSLEAITNVFTAAGAMPQRANGSALNHLRTNDFLPAAVDIAKDPWDIRDFELNAATHRLMIIHPNKESMEFSNGFIATAIPGKLSSLTTFVNGIPFPTTTSQPNPDYTIPAAIQAIHGPMRISPLVRYHWRGNPSNVMTALNRREFSFNTCSGCHKGETFNPFTHVRPRNTGNTAVLSGFMTGMGADDDFSATDNDNDPMGFFTVRDPGPNPLPNKRFNEALARAIDLEKLIFNSPCISRIPFPRELQNIIAIHQILKFRPLNMEH